jgi:hypothetical protein
VRAFKPMTTRGLTTYSIQIVSLTLVALLSFIFTACGGSLWIPRFKGRIYTLDDQKLVLRYRFDRDVLPLTTLTEADIAALEQLPLETREKIRGAVVFLPPDAERFIETYIVGCKEWKKGVEMIEVKEEDARKLLKAPEKKP